MASGTRPIHHQQVSTTSTQVSHHDEEQALETHEVIELQAFSERKAWIEHKIKVRTSRHYPCLQN